MLIYWKYWKYWIGILGFVLVCGTHASAQEQAPTDLLKWRNWILEKHPKQSCMPLASQLDQRICAWPSILKAEVSAQGMRFSQSWRLDAAGEVSLPGNPRLWPLDVTVDDKPAKVLFKNNKAMVQLDAGNHRIRGFIAWSAPPQQIALPEGSYRVQLFRDKEKVDTPFISKNGALWLSRNEDATSSERDSAVIEVYRSIQDTIPRRVLTELKLSISGGPRELLAGALRLPDTETQWLNSPLPAKLEEDGNLRVQVRSGEWSISHLARFKGDINDIRASKQTENWPQQELWGFQPKLALRRVKVGGASQVDGKQIDYPNFLDNQALYLIKTTDTLRLEEVDRGMNTRATSDLTLHREIWPDINGDHGATIEDKITGQVKALWRIETNGSFELGSVEINHTPVVVTELSEISGAGFELNSALVNINAAGSVAQLGDLNASGWQTSLTRVTHLLNLPPSWRVWHVGGPDSVNGTWLAKWDLWSIFLCLLVVGTMGRLLAWPWAVIALAAGALHYHTPNSVYLWAIPLLICLPLLRVLPSNAFRLSIQIAAGIFAALALIVLLQFSVSHIRGVIYPQLAEKVHSPNNRHLQSEAVVKTVDVSAPVAQRRMEKEADAIEEVVAYGVKQASSKTPYFENKKIAESETVQTGPGIPNWRWDNIRYSWTGPVLADQPLTLWTTHGWLTRCIALLEWLLVVALFLGILRALLPVVQPLSKAMNAKAAPASLLFGLFGVVLSGLPEITQAQNYPPTALLEEYEKRLLKTPDCAPICYTINKGQVLIDNDVLRIDLSVSVGAETAIPLPSSEKWTPISMSANGKSLLYMRRISAQDHIRLTPGVHSLRLIGRVQADKFTLAFPKHSFNIQVQANKKDWLVSGTRDNTLSGNTLSFEKKEKTTIQNTLIQEPAAKFAKVTRWLSLSNDWILVTTVQRIAPANGAIRFNIPLLPGEQILSQDIEVTNGLASVQLSGTEKRVSWRSQLEPVPNLMLTHRETFNWTENWSVAFSPRWHLTHTGLPPIENTNIEADHASAEREWHWQPWPGESVQLNIARPKATAGRTITVEQVSLKSQPGLRVTKNILQLTARSSLGEDYRITLPDTSELKSVTIGGQNIPARILEGILTLPLSPGENRLEIQWHDPVGVQTIFSTPKVSLQTPARNIELKISMPRHRWPLILSGPQLGPAVLFWSTLTIILLLALGIGLLRKRLAPGIPLSTPALILLGLGVSTAWKLGGVLIILWFIAFEWRKRKATAMRADMFNLFQIGLVCLTALTFLSLFANVPYGLLSAPNMHITGNQSSGYLYTWYSDAASETLPQGTAISISLWFYRLAMLAWSLWLVFALLNWLRWGWQCFSAGALWQSKPKKEA